MKNTDGQSGVFKRDFEGKETYWIASPTRADYASVFFGLAVAYRLLLNDENVQSQVQRLVSRMVEHLEKNKWFIINPNLKVSGFLVTVGY